MSEPADARGLTRRALLGTGASLALTPAAFAQSSYPSKPLRLIVPFPGGSSPDVIARLVRALGISSAHRVEALADIAPLADTFRGFEGESWHGVFAPKGTPDNIVSTIVEHSQRIVGSADFRGTLTGYGLVPVGGSSADFRQFLVADASAWSRVIRSNNITLD